MNEIMNIIRYYANYDKNNFISSLVNDNVNKQDTCMIKNLNTIRCFKFEVYMT